MKGYYVYIVMCKDKSLYVGITNSIDRRIAEHNEGLIKNSYTYNKRPAELIFRQKFIQFEQAEQFEKKIKKWSKNKKLALANGDFEALKDLASCKNKSHSKNHMPLDSARDDSI